MKVSAHKASDSQQHDQHSLQPNPGGLGFETDSGDSLGLRGHAAFEPEVLSALTRHIRPGMSVVDAGAHIGFFTMHMARLVGQHGRVHAFEPEQENLRLLRRNIAHEDLRNVEVHGVALGEHDDVGTLRLSDYSTGMHRLYDSLCCGSASAKVPVRRLDAIFSPGDINVLKIDVEGFEPFVLAGARSLIRGRNLVMISEYCAPAMIEAGASIRTYLAWLKHEGYFFSDAEASPLPWAALETDACRWEDFGRARLRDACASKSNPEIAATCEQIARDLGCMRPIIENLVIAPLGQWR